MGKVNIRANNLKTKRSIILINIFKRDLLNALDVMGLTITVVLLQNKPISYFIVLLLDLYSTLRSVFVFVSFFFSRIVKEKIFNGDIMETNDKRGTTYSII